MRILIYLSWIFHIISSTEKYLEYRTSTESYVGTPDKEYIPTFGICLPIDDWNDTMTFEDVKNYFLSINETAAIFISSLPFAEYITYQYFMSRKKCFSLYLFNQLYSKSNQKMLDIQFLQDISCSIPTEFHIKYPMTNPVHEIDAYAITNTVLNMPFEYNTEFTDTINLPFPFASNCIDYNTLGLQSREGCRQNCMLEYHQRKN